MVFTQLVHTATVLILCQRLSKVVSQQCKDEYSISGMMLKRHVFKITKTPVAFDCLQACNDDDRCQSFNYVISQEICELNNRTKEAKPEDFVPCSERYYFRKTKNRVSLGCSPEIPAESCKEIKSSEGGQVVSGKYWFDSIIPGKVVLAHCGMETEDIDECSASINVCDVLNTICVNTIGSFICNCANGYTGDGKSCVLLPCTQIGVADISKIADNQITASTVYFMYYPYKGRLHGQYGWCASTKNNINDFIQVDLEVVHVICAVATQGKKDGSYVTSYKVFFSIDGVIWNAYKVNNVDKVFQGNVDLETVVQHSLNISTQARYVRLYPVTHSTWPCMRIELFVR